MTANFPQHLIDEQRAVEDEIREAFRGVSRDNGVSWKESVVIDDYGAREGNKARATARAADTDLSWEELVDDPTWDDDKGVGGFTFLDPIGFRYYVAPAMIRAVRRGYGGAIDFALTIDGPWMLDRISLVTPRQAQAIAHFIRAMMAIHDALGDDIGAASWRAAHRSHWDRYDQSTQATPR